MNNQEPPIKTHSSLDCRGQLCPVPILMTEEKIAGLKVGEILKILYTDPGAKPDLMAWCKINGHLFLKAEESKRESLAYIQK